MKTEYETKAQRRHITSYYRETFDWHDHEVVGYLVAGDLYIDEPCDEAKEIHAGDWSVVTYADVWSMTHNTDQESYSPVCFWGEDHKTAIIYYKTQDDAEFRVVHVAFS